MSDQRSPILSIEIQPNERGFITGKTGSGKSFMARRLLRQVNRLVVLDSKGTLDEWGLEPWDRDTARRLDEGENVRIRAAVEFGGDADRYWSDVLEACYNAQNVTVYIDEGYQVLKSGNKESEIAVEGVLTRGRELHVSLIIASQRPRWLPLFVLSEADHYFMFRLQLEKDREYMAQFMGEAVAEPIPIKDRYGFWYYNTRELEPVYIPKLPARAPELENAEIVPAVELTPEEEPTT